MRCVVLRHVQYNKMLQSLLNGVLSILHHLFGNLWVGWIQHDRNNPDLDFGKGIRSHMPMSGLCCLETSLC